MCWTWHLVCNWLIFPLYMVITYLSTSRKLQMSLPLYSSEIPTVSAARGNDVSSRPSADGRLMLRADAIQERD